MFTVHADGLIAGDVFDSPVAATKPTLEEPPEGVPLSESEEWWRNHVAQFREWARQRYGIELDRREALVLMGSGPPKTNTVPIGGVEYMLSTPPGVESVDDGMPLSYRFGIVQPGRISELAVRGRPDIP